MSENGDAVNIEERLRADRPPYASFRDALHTRLFHAWCASVHVSENVRFWHAVESYRERCHTGHSPAAAALCAAWLVRTFVATDAPEQCNLDHSVRVACLGDFDAAVRSAEVRFVASMFDAAQEQVFELMRNDLWIRFIDSAVYLNAELASRPAKVSVPPPAPAAGRLFQKIFGGHKHAADNELRARANRRDSTVVLDAFLKAKLRDSPVAAAPAPTRLVRVVAARPVSPAPPRPVSPAPPRPSSPAPLRPLSPAVPAAVVVVAGALPRTSPVAPVSPPAAADAAPARVTSPLMLRPPRQLVHDATAPPPVHSNVKRRAMKISRNFDVLAQDDIDVRTSPTGSSDGSDSLTLSPVPLRPAVRRAERVPLSKLAADNSPPPPAKPTSPPSPLSPPPAPSPAASSDAADQAPPPPPPQMAASKMLERMREQVAALTATLAGLEAKILKEPGNEQLQRLQRTTRVELDVLLRSRAVVEARVKREADANAAVAPADADAAAATAVPQSVTAMHRGSGTTRLRARRALDDRAGLRGSRDDISVTLSSTGTFISATSAAPRRAAPLATLTQSGDDSAS